MDFQFIDNKKASNSMVRSLVDNCDVYVGDAFISHNTVYEVMCGSLAYDADVEGSDRDVAAICVPPQDIVFPHLAGEIPGFGKHKKAFKSLDLHHLETPWRTVDLSVHNIVHFFQLCMDNNPNRLEPLFVPDDLVVYSTKVGDMIRDRRDIFLHKGAFFKYKGFAYSQVQKMMNSGKSSERRFKYGYHAVRLIDNIVELLSKGTLTLGENGRKLREIRNEKWSFKLIEAHFETLEKEAQYHYDNSTALPHKPDEAAIKQLLLDCLEEYWGSIDDCLPRRV